MVAKFKTFVIAVGFGIFLSTVNSGAVFRKCDFTSSNKSLEPGYFCKIKTYGHQNTSLNVHFVLNRPVSDIKVSLFISFLKSTNLIIFV